MWETLKQYLQAKDRQHLKAELNTFEKSELWGLIALFIKARSEEAKHNLYVNIQQTNRHNEAAFEGGKEVALLYVSDQLIKDVGAYLDNQSPITESPRPEEE